MENIKIAIICFCLSLCFSCTSSSTSNNVNVDMENRLSLELANNYLQFDSLIRVSSKEFLISSFDKMIRYNSSLFVLDKMQQVVFKIDTSTKNVHKVISRLGKAKNEYIDITDIAIDDFCNIYVYDSESGKVNVYNKSGHYLRTINVVFGSSMAVSKQNEIAINSNQSEDDLIFVFSDSGKELYHTTPDSQVPEHTFDEVGIISSFGNGFVYTRPFDFNVYQTNGASNTSLALFSFGEKQFDVNTLKGMDIRDFQKIMYKSTDKIMSLSHLCVYKDLLFFSTDKNDQVLFDMVRNDAFVLSNLERPYNILFYSLFSVNENGHFCSVISNDNIKNGYLPMIETNGAKQPQLRITRNEVDDDENAFWILMGKVKCQ